MALEQLVFGLDGGTFSVLEPLAEAGRLPTFARLMAEGVAGVLRSTTPPLTAPAWCSFMTGLPPGRHGVYDFCALEPGGYATPVINGSHLRTETVFQRLNAAGKRVGLLNVPFTYPPPPLDGFVVSGMDAPVLDARAVWPPELYQQLVSEVGPLSVRAVPPQGRQYDLGAVERQIDRLFEYAEHLLTRCPVEVFVMVTNTVDHLQHFFWQKREVRARDGQLIADIVAHGYERVDRRLGELLARFGEGALTIVLSDHGAGPITRHFNLERWLREAGLLAYRRQAVSRGAATAIKALARQILPRSARDRLARAAPGARDVVRQASLRGHIDWSRTRAFPWGSFGYLQLNLRGREPEGIVDPGPEADDVRRGIREGLLALRDPTTEEAVVEAVLAAEELYGGQPRGRPPDLVVVPAGYRYDFLKPASEDAPLFAEAGARHAGPLATPKTGTHTMDGIFIAAGPGAPRKAVTRIEEVARVMAGASDDDDSAAQAPGPEVGRNGTGAYTDREAEAVARRLRELGYLG